MSDRFHEGQRLHWTTISEIKVVVFRSLVDPDTAAVTFGDHNWSAPVSELSRINPPVLAHPVVPIPPPEIEAPSLAERRHALKSAFDKHRTAQAATSRALEIADSAMRVVVESQQRLCAHANLETEAVDEIVASLRDGEETRPLHSLRWVQAEQLRRDTDICEKAYDKVTQDLARCREQERAALDQVYKLSADIVGIILSSEIEKLHELEQRAAEVRAKLEACCLFWPPSVESLSKPLSLTPTAQTIINSDPPAIHDPTGYEIREKLRQERQQAFIALFERLVNGDADADLASE